MEVLPIIIAVICSAVLTTWVIAKWYYTDKYSAIIDHLNIINGNWRQHSIDVENELRDIAAGMIAAANHVPDVIGIAVTEPEDIDNKPVYDNWLKSHPEEGIVPYWDRRTPEGQTP